MLYRILLAVDLIAVAIIVWFFVIGLADGSVSSFNAGLWAAILAALAAILGGGIALRRYGKTALANVVLAILAAPTVGYGLFMALLILTVERWN